MVTHITLDILYFLYGLGNDILNGYNSYWVKCNFSACKFVYQSKQRMRYIHVHMWYMYKTHIYIYIYAYVFIWQCRYTFSVVELRRKIRKHIIGAHMLETPNCSVNKLTICRYFHNFHYQRNDGVSNSHHTCNCIMISMIYTRISLCKCHFPKTCTGIKTPAHHKLPFTQLSKYCVQYTLSCIRHVWHTHYIWLVNLILMSRSRWIPHTKASDAELWCFLWSASE